VDLRGNLMHRINVFIRKNEPNYERVELHHLIERAAALVVPDPNYPPTNICYKFDKTIPIIEVDAIKIKIVILNLIVNGIESMYGIENHTSEVIVQTVYENNDYFSLLIMDSGCGIPYDIRDKVFDACFSTKKNGVGMGLTISKGIIEEHKGTIAFYPLANQGTCFKVTMPISPKIFAE
jgi:nitrogen-specific signal transduction histidine kinase